MPAEVTVYYPSQTGWVKANLAVQWDAVPEHATAQEGNFEVIGHVLGTDLTTKMQVTVVTKGNQVISENASNNATDSKAFASTTNDTQAASRDKIFYINDGHFNEDGRWTNWSRTPKDQETSVGILFKKNGQITPQSVGKVAIQFFKDSGTDAPATMVLERYVGPAYTEPSTISRYEENADHPFNKAENWQEIPYKASGDIVAGKPIEFTFDPIQTTAIRARMTRKSTTNGLAMVEFSAYSPAKANDVETPSVTISVAGKALENFDPAVSDYTVNLNGTKPQVTAQVSGHGVTTVVESSQDNLPSLVRLLAKDGSLVKEYRIHFKPSHRIVPEEGDQSPVLERPSLEVVKTEIPFKEIIRENNDLAQDERRVISEGKKGERVDYVDVLGSNRTTVHTDTTEAQDRVVEVKVKPAITTSKGDEPAPVVEVPEFEGGVNAVEAAKHELPEYTEAVGTVGDEPAPVVEVPEFEGGVNAVEAAKHELPEYTAAIGTVGDEPAPVVEVPEFEGGVNAVEATKNELPEYTEAIGTVGDEPAPVVEVPEFEGGVNAVEAAKNELPEYTDVIGTAGDEPAPVVEIPEFKGGVNAVEAAKNEVPEFTGGVNAAEAVKNELPEYTGTVATAGNEPAPSLVKPAEEVRILTDKETGVLVAGLTTELSKDLKLQVQKVLRQELAGKHYDAYQVKLLDKDNQEVDLKGAVLVRLPVKGQVQGVYHMSLDQGLQVQKVTLVGDTVEFVTKDLGLYAIVYKEQNQEPVKPVEQAYEPAVKGENFENASEKVDSARLPETGESRSDTAAFLASLSLVLSVALLTVKRKEK